MDEQRKRVYGYRQRILDGVNCRDLIIEMIDREVDAAPRRSFSSPTYGSESFAAAAGNLLHVQLDAKDFRNADFKDAERMAVDEASRMAESQVLDAIEENLPDDEDQSEWNWDALAKSANTRWGLNLRDRDLKKIGRESLAEELIKTAHEAIERDRSVGLRPLLGAGLRRAARPARWLHDKFGVEIAPEEATKLEPAAVHRAGAQAGHRRVRPARIRISGPRRPVSLLRPRLDRRAARLVARGPGRMGQAAVRCRARASTTSRTSSARKSAQLLVEHSQKNNEKANQVAAEAQQRVEQLFAGEPQRRGDARRRHRPATASSTTSPPGSRTTCNAEITSDELAELDREAAAAQGVASRRRPLPPRNAADGAGAAPADPRHGLERTSAGDGPPAVQRRPARLRPGRSQGRIQARRHAAVRQHVDQRRQLRDRPDLQDGTARRRLRRQHLGRSGQRSRKKPSRPAKSSSQQQAAIAGTEADKKLEPIRNLGPKVGRNDPCPCGSGKKYKQCCMRKRRRVTTEARVTS